MPWGCGPGGGVDVASGPGATARMLATEYAVTVDGIDLSEPTLQRARSATADAGLSSVVRFHLGDAERLPLPGRGAPTLWCASARCAPSPTRPESSRRVRPGAAARRSRSGITDVVVAERGLPAELRTLAAWVACIADARTTKQYTDLLAGAGLVTRHVEEHDDALAWMVDQIQARVQVLRMAAADRLDAAGVDVDAVLHYTALAKQAVDEDLIGYRLLVAEKPA